MKTDSTMLELRKIRDENSERHLSMTAEEQKKESQDVLEWFTQASRKPLKLVRPK